jgi:hypothetical protein
MIRLSALLLLATALVVAACGSSPPSTEELQAQLGTIPARPADLTAVEANGAWNVSNEGPVSGTAFGVLSDGILSAAATQGGIQPIDAYERELEASGVPTVERPYPAVAYSAALLFESAGDAQAFYEAADAAARETDWLVSNPDGATVGSPEVDEETLASATVVDQVLWLHSSGIAGDTTYTDDVLLVRDGRMVAMVRAPGTFTGADVRRGSNAVFEAGQLIPVANRLHRAVD